MRVRALDVARFGALVDRSFVLDADAVVVIGRNEAGKSSFHAALRAVLFGFSPASARIHPYARRLGGGADEEDIRALQVAATLGFDDGRPDLLVERRLTTNATMRCAPVGEPIGAFVRENGALPGFESATGELFDSVYSISSNEVLEPSEDLGGEIERLLLGEGATPGLIAVRDLGASLDAERTRLWRRDRRSRKTRALEIDARLAELAREARAARRVEAELVAIEEELEQRRVRSVDLEARRAACEAERNALRLVERAARIVHESQALAGVDLAAIEDIDLSAPGPLVAELEDAEDALDEPTERLSRPEALFDEDDERLLARGAEIEAIARTETELDHLARRREDSLDRAADATRAAEEIKRSVLEGTSQAHEARALRELYALGDDWRERIERAAETRRSPDALAFGAAALLGAIGGGAVLAIGSAGAGAMGAFLLPIGAVAVDRALAARGRERETSVPDDVTRHAKDAGIDLDLVKSPQQLFTVVEKLQRAAALVEEACTHDERAIEAQRRQEEIESGWSALAEDVGVVARTDAALPGALRHALDASRTRQLEASADRAERGRAVRELARARERFDATTERFDALREALHHAVPNETSPERGYQRVAEARATRERAQGALRELAVDPAWHSVKGTVRMQRALENGAFEAQDLRAAEAAVRDVVSEIAREREESARLEERLAHQRPPRSASEVASESATLREERDETLLRHDRLALMRALLDAGERAHRAAHQPDVLQRASGWMNAISNGRYPRLDVPPQGGQLLVYSREAGATVPLGPPFSRGVREQARLCLRLGTLEHLDGERESLPIVLDEALVHWDAERRAALYEVLGRLRGQRQVLLFTCHEALAREAIQGLDALDVSL